MTPPPIVNLPPPEVQDGRNKLLSPISGENQRAKCNRSIDNPTEKSPSRARPASTHIHSPRARGIRSTRPEIAVFLLLLLLRQQQQSATPPSSLFPPWTTAIVTKCRPTCPTFGLFECVTANTRGGGGGGGGHADERDEERRAECMKRADC